MQEDKKTSRSSSVVLSTVACLSSAFSSDSLRCNFREIQAIDRVPAPLSTAKNLDLAHNSLQTLEGIEQFKSLRSIVLDYNLLDDVMELARLSTLSSLTHLSVVGNPISLHPDLIPSILRLCPQLREINGISVTSSTFREIELGEVLAAKLIPYFYTNERMLIALDQASKRVRLSVEIADLPYGLRSQAISLIRRKRERCVPFPTLTFPQPDAVLPSTILQYIQYVETEFHPLFPAISGVYQFEVRKCVNWLYHELILCLHNAGYYELHRYLQRRYYSAPTLEDEFIVEFKEFLMLGKSQEADEMPYFPIFSCNFDYLKALYGILEKQIATFEAIYMNFISFLDNFLYDIDSNSYLTDPESALPPPHCYTPPQLPSFLIDKSQDIDVQVLFPDEYTFRNRDLAMELREIGKKRPDLDAISYEFRDRMIQRRALKMWKEGVYVKSRQKEAVAEAVWVRNCMKKVVYRWKTGIRKGGMEEIARMFEDRKRKQWIVKVWRGMNRKRRREREVYMQICMKKRTFTLSSYFHLWLSSQRLPITVKVTPTSSASLLKECEALLGRIQTIETRYTLTLDRKKPSKPRRGLSLSQQQSKLHREVKEMTRGKLKG